MFGLWGSLQDATLVLFAQERTSAATSPTAKGATATATFTGAAAASSEGSVWILDMILDWVTARQAPSEAAHTMHATCE